MATEGFSQPLRCLAECPSTEEPRGCQVVLEGFLPGRFYTCMCAVHVLCCSIPTRPATSVYQPRHDQMEQGPTEPHAGHSTFLLSSGGAGGGYY